MLIYSILSTKHEGNHLKNVKGQRGRHCFRIDVLLLTHCQNYNRLIMPSSTIHIATFQLKKKKKRHLPNPWIQYEWRSASISFLHSLLKNEDQSRQSIYEAKMIWTNLSGNLPFLIQKRKNNMKNSRKIKKRRLFNYHCIQIIWRMRPKKVIGLTPKLYLRNNTQKEFCI